MAESSPSPDPRERGHLGPEDAPPAPDWVPEDRSEDPWRRPDPSPATPPSPFRNAATIGLALALAVSVLVNGMLSLRLRDAQDETQTLRRQVREQAQDLEALREGLRGVEGGSPLRTIEEAVGRIRALEYQREVQSELLTPAQLRARVRRLFTQDNKRSEVEATENVLKTLGVLPADVDLFDLLLALHEEQVAGFYDTEAKELVVSTRSGKDPSPLDRVVLAHELTHALTDQHFGLGRTDKLIEQNRDDEAEAFLALAEGDAQLTMGIYQREVLTQEEQLRLVEEAGALQSSQFERAPPFIREALEFRYTQGLEFVRALHQRGGFKLVDDAYRDPPTSTEQILHPSRYIERRDDPTTVTMPDVAASLGRGWRVIERGAVGELDIRLITDYGGEPALSSRDARRAAEGWDGGQYVALEAREGVVVAIATAWDSESEAREAARLLGRWLPLRYGNEGSEFDTDGTGKGWQSRRGAGAVVRDGDRVQLLLGPSRDAVMRARGAFGSS